jgi:hypothetical protein
MIEDWIKDTVRPDLMRTRGAMHGRAHDSLTKTARVRTGRLRSSADAGRASEARLSGGAVRAAFSGGAIVVYGRRPTADVEAEISAIPLDVDTAAWIGVAYAAGFYRRSDKWKLDAAVLAAIG